MGRKIALDIGISSVGWAVVSDNYDIIDAAVRLFESADASKNTDRRDFRGTKRLLRRKKHRIERFDKQWSDYQLELGRIDDIDPLFLRNKGLKDKLTQNEIYIVLRNMLKHRGISYLDDAIDENATGDYKKSLSLNEKLLKDKYPCEVQLSRLNSYGRYRGNFIVNMADEDIALSNVFTSSSYEKEILAILENQSSYHTFIDDNFIEDYLIIFKSKRAYYDGPGNEQSRTDYGRYTTKTDSEGNYITDDNLFEKLIGKCSVYPDELRGSGASYTAQEFNLLNDLNNLKVNGRKLQTKEKEEVVELIKQGKPNMRKIIAQVIGEPIEYMSGARVDGSEKEIFSMFDAYKKLKKHFSSLDIDINNYSRKELDDLADRLTINTDKDSIMSSIKNSSLEFDDDVIESLVSFRKKNSSLFNKWHSLSLRVMNELMEGLYNEPKNQMQLLADKKLIKSKNEVFKGLKKIPSEILVDDIYNPIVKRAVREAVKVLNALIKKYGWPDDIIIEMARDKNEADARKRIKDGQSKNNKELDKIKNDILSQYGIQILDKHFHNHKKLKTKLRLWAEQEGRCPYSGKLIKITDLLNERSFFEIDHIIPISISFDDSRTNKVLVYSQENQLKGNKTPYMYLNNVQREWNFDKFNYFIEDLSKRKKINRKKKMNFLFRENITKQDVLKGFISRNINDTRYASRVVLNGIQSFVKANSYDTKVKVIRGSFTSQLRNKLKLEKNREEKHSHHAVDAMIMCYSQMGLEKYKYDLKEVLDFETGEILDVKKYEQLSDEEKYNYSLFYYNIAKMNEKIVEAEKLVRYSYKVDRKVNRQLTNATIYGVREREGKLEKVSKIKDIYSKEGFESFKKRIKKPETFLMYHHDPKTFEILMKIVDQYKDQPNPFQAYKEEMGEPIKKFAKKNNGPVINSLKYYDGEVNSCLDISHKYGHNPGSKKVILDSLKPYRMDVYYRKEDESYHLVGVKYANFKFDNNEYVLDENSYTQILRQEKILSENQQFADMNSLGYEFKFSLYKNDFILYEKKGEEYIERFLSRTMPKQKNYIETKPLDKSKFNKQNLIGLSKTKKIIKINVDVLGNMHFLNKEKFSLRVILDN